MTGNDNMQQAETQNTEIIINGQQSLTTKVQKERTFNSLCLIAIGMAFFGFLFENIARLVSVGIIDSRFHILPFISPYGFIVFAFYLGIGDPDDYSFFGKHLFKEKSKKTKILSNLFSLFLICLFIFLGELVVGNLWELLFGVQLWDYSKNLLHITQYTSGTSTFGGGIVIYLILKFVYRPILKFLEKKINLKVAKVVNAIVCPLLILDTVRMIVCMAILGEAPMIWSITIFSK